MTTGYRAPGVGYRDPLPYRGVAVIPPPPPPDPGPLVPLPPDHPLYRVVITDRSGFGLAEVPARNLVYSYVLNSPGACSFTVPVLAPEATPEILSPGEREIHVYRGDVLVWGGFLWTAMADVDGDVRVGGQGYQSILYHRYIDQTFTFANYDQFTIARILLDYTQAKPGGDFGLTFPSSGASDVFRARTYFGYERKNLGDAIEELAAVDNGFDFEINAAKEWRTYYPFKGTNTGFVFELGKNIRGMSWVKDATEIANTITAIGSGEGADQILGVASDSASINKYGLMEDTRSFLDVEEQSTIDAHAKEELRLVKGVQDQPQLAINTQGDADPPYGSYVVGDTVRVRANHGYIQIDKNYRIVSVSVALSNEGLESTGLFFNEAVTV